MDSPFQNRSLAWLRQGLARSTALLVLALCLFGALAMGLASREVLDLAMRRNLEDALGRDFERAQTGFALWRRQEVEELRALAADAKLLEQLRRGRAGEPAARERLQELLASEPDALALAVVAARADAPEICATTWLPESWHESIEIQPSLARTSATIARIDGTVVDLVKVPLKVPGEQAFLLGALNPLLAPALVPDRSEADLVVLGEDGAPLLGSPAAFWILPPAGMTRLERHKGQAFLALRKSLADTPWQLVIMRPIPALPAGTILNVVLASLVVAFVAGSIAFGVGVWRMRPMLELIDGAQRIAAGELGFRVRANSTDDEVQLLARSFNEMAGQLEAQRRALEERHQDLLRANEVLEQLSITDGLTHLHNHRHFHDQFAREVKRADRSGQPLCLLLIDVDDFKQLNDRYGHAAGDRVLAVAAQLMHAQVRDSDYVARYGGEEFAMLLPQTGLDGAVALAEKIRAVLSEHRFDLPDREEVVHLTVSIGVAEHVTTADDTFDAADRALYEAKNAGKDCVATAPREGRALGSPRRRR